MSVNLKLQTKLFVLVTLVVVVFFVAVIVIVSGRSMALAKNDAFTLAQETADKYQNEIRAEVQGARITAETLSIVLETLKDHDLTDRGVLNDILKNALVEKEYITGFCIAYEPNGLDGKDAEYAGVGPWYDETGRFKPYWNKLDGNIDVEPLSVVEGEDWWEVPKATKREYITNPYPYHLQGHTVLLTSMMFPILHDGDYIGVIASDIVLDKLQQMVASVSARAGKNEQTRIFSNDGTVAAHPDSKYLAKNLAEVVFYETVLESPDGAKRALAFLDDYLESHPSPDASDTEAAETYNGLLTFELQLAAYAKQPAVGKPDIALLTKDAAKAMLLADPKVAASVIEIGTAIRTGQRLILSDDDYYTIYMPIRFSDAANPWSVVVRISMDEVMKNATDIRNYVLIVSIIAIIIVAGVVYLLARRFAQPILKLAETAREYGEGNFDAEVPSVRSGDEIGILAGAFRTMVAQINDLFAKSTASREEAEASSRAKSVFLSNMSHEMRTPLNAIIGMTTIGRNANDLDKKDYSFGKIDEASNHLLGVINDILDISKIEAGKLELSYMEFEFDEMIRKAVNVITFRAAEKNQNFLTDIDSSIPNRLMGDDQHLTQIVLNLLSNAVKFTPEGGDVKLAARLEGEEDGICTILFEVSDTGIGISAEQQKLLFNSFQQADNSTSRKYGGTGLGLVISKNLVELMGGEIRIDSEPGKGATFIFTVQIQRAVDAPGDFENDIEDEGVAQGAPSVFAGQRVLLAEDVEINREIMLVLLEPTELLIDCAEDGEQALAMFETDPERYDLIFMDMQMPNMDGLEATRRIRKCATPRATQIPIIAMTANVFKEDIENCLEAGMNGHIGKPVDMEAVLSVLREYLAKPHEA